MIIQEIAIISASETDRNKAEQLLNEHQKDFDVHYQENENKLKDIRETVIFCILIIFYLFRFRNWKKFYPV